MRSTGIVVAVLVVQVFLPQALSQPRDPCANFECENGGSCTAPADAPFCLCLEGFTGERCEDKIKIIIRDPCANFECQNGGSCTAPADAPFCLCLEGFTGERCENRIISRDPCRFDTSCQNGGTCISPLDVPICQCREGFTGEKCEIRLTPGVKPGQCPKRDQFNVCSRQSCKIDDDCRGDEKCCPSDCGNSICKDPAVVIIDPCRDFCLNGGRCSAPADAPVCTCRRGFTGKRCEERTISRDPCRRFRCRNGGKCIAPADRPFCQCPAGFTGRRCQIRTGGNKPGICPLDTGKDDCSGRICYRDSNCRGDQKCCASSCGRKRCKDPAVVIFNPCAGFCLNGGECTAPADAPICTCAPGFSGRRCQVSGDGGKERPGTCPIIKPGQIGICGGVFCEVDNDCREGQKCCPSACGGDLCTVPENIPPPPPPIDLFNPCITVRCSASTVCRVVFPCDTCEPTVGCVEREALGSGIDIECERQGYLEVLLVASETKPTTYSQLKCRGPLATRDCPSPGSVCVDDLRGGGTCCRGKPSPPVEKPGTCPKPGPIGVCGGVFCEVDNDCREGQKCCPSACGGNLCTVIDPCLDFCQNGASCSALDGVPICVCPPGFTGKRCDEKLIIFNPCAGFCLNGGECTAPADAPICTCAPGFSGRRCQVSGDGGKERPGTCPIIKPGQIGICGGVFCEVDNDCREGQKCCPSACGGDLCTVPENIPPPPPPIDLFNPCIAVLCPASSVCRVVFPCDTCEPTVSCVEREALGSGIDIECERQGYLEVLLVASETKPTTYSQLKCRGPLATRDCPSPGSVCVDDLRGGGTCCRGKPSPPVEKPGTCPKGPIFRCGGVPCETDSDCPDVQKCCVGCGQFCAQPVLGEECGNSRCAEGEVCVQKTPECPPGRACIQALLPTCVPQECKDCGPNESCERGSKGFFCASPCGAPCGPDEECRKVSICSEEQRGSLGTCKGVFNCVKTDNCGGCPKGQICVDTGIRCVTTPCPSFQCRPIDKCGGCPDGQKCELLPTPCANPEEFCRDILQQDPTAECTPPPCEDVPTCVDDTFGELVTPRVCALRCPPNFKCEFVKPNCRPGTVCSTTPVAECVPDIPDPGTCPRPSRSFPPRHIVCILEKFRLRACKQDSECRRPVEKCCTTKCQEKFCLSVEKRRYD